MMLMVVRATFPITCLKRLSNTSKEIKVIGAIKVTLIAYHPCVIMVQRLRYNTATLNDRVGFV